MAAKKPKPEVIAPAPKAAQALVQNYSGGYGTPTTPKAATPQTSVATTVAKANALIESMKQTLADAYVAQGLNPDGSAKAVTTTTRVQANEARKAAGPPYTAPTGFRWSWVGTEYKLYANTPTQTPDASTGETGAMGGTGNVTTAAATPTTDIEVLKSMIKGLGFSANIVDTSASYLNSLLKEGLDYDNAVQVFLNSKDYTLKNGTKISSPFYETYGYLNEGLEKTKTPSEIFNAVEGYKELKIKYGFSDKYLSKEALQGYVKNNVTVSDLDERANTARLAGITADASKTAALIKLGFIADSGGLTDFFMDFKIGKEQLEQNRNTAAFTAEAIRRASAGIKTEATQIEDFKKIAASMTAKGYTEAQISQLASSGFQSIAENLTGTTALAGIYQKAGGTEKANAELTSQIQSELTQEQFNNMPSSRRKLLEEQNKKAFQGTAGLTSGSLKTTGMI
jgi:hypothetical protein